MLTFVSLVPAEMTLLNVQLLPSMSNAFFTLSFGAGIFSEKNAIFIIFPNKNDEGFFKCYFVLSFAFSHNHSFAVWFL